MMIPHVRILFTRYVIFHCTVVSGVETRGSGGSMNWGPRVVGPQKNFPHYEKYCLHCVNCTKFDQLILTKISKFIATNFKAKMHQIQFRLGLRPRLRCGSLQRTPDPLAGTTSKGMGGEEWGKGRERKERGREGGRGEERERIGPPSYCWTRALLRHWLVHVSAYIQ